MIWRIWSATVGEATHDVGRGVVQRFTRRHLFRGSYIRHDLLAGLCARRRAGQCQRRAHQLEKVSATDRVSALVKCAGECHLALAPYVDVDRVAHELSGGTSSS